MQSLVKVGKGFGFLVRGNQLYILTAASLINEYVEREEDNRVFLPKILKTIDGQLSAYSECVYLDQNIAILTGQTDGINIVAIKSFENLVANMNPLRIAKPPEPHENDFAANFEASILRATGEIKIKVLRQGNILWIKDQSPVGLPVLHQSNVIGIVTDANPDPLEGGKNTILFSALPNSLELEIAASPQIPFNKKQRERDLQSFKAREAIGFADGREFYSKHGDSNPPKNESDNDRVSILDRFPKLARNYVRTNWKIDNGPLYDEKGSSYLSGFLKGVIAAKQEQQAQEEKAKQIRVHTKIIDAGADCGKAKLVKTIGIKTGNIGF